MTARTGPPSVQEKSFDDTRLINPISVYPRRTYSTTDSVSRFKQGDRETSGIFMVWWGNIISRLAGKQGEQAEPMGYAINGLIKAEQLDFLTFLTRSISPKLTLPRFVRSARLRTVSSSTFTSNWSQYYSVQPPLIRNSRRGKLRAGRAQQGLRNTPDRELENPRANKKYFKCQEQTETNCVNYELLQLLYCK